MGTRRILWHGGCHKFKREVEEPDAATDLAIFGMKESPFVREVHVLLAENGRSTARVASPQWPTSRIFRPGGHRPAANRVC